MKKMKLTEAEISKVIPNEWDWDYLDYGLGIHIFGEGDIRLQFLGWPSAEELKDIVAKAIAEELQ